MKKQPIRPAQKELELFIQLITKKAGNITWEKFGKVGVAYTKQNAADVVTAADLAANRFLVNAIKKKYPQHGIISEEEVATNQNAEYVWIIDPLDGTRNFVTELPLFGTLVALTKNGKLLLAAMSYPALNELYFAKKGGGAWRNGKRIHCSTQKNLRHSFGLAGANIIPPRLPTYRRLLLAAKKNPYWMNLLGSAAVSSVYAASGRRDWYISLEGRAWDYAAPVLILQESGCRVTNLKGREWQLKDNGLIAANPVLHKQILKIVSGKK